MNGADIELVLCGALVRGELRPSDCQLKPDDFADPQAREVFRAAVGLEANGQEVSLVTLGEALPSALLDTAIDMASKADLAFGADHLQQAAAIRNNAQRRRLAAIAQKLQEGAQGNGEPVKLAGECWDALSAVMSDERKLETRNLALVSQSVLDRRNHPEARALPAPCGLPRLDVMLNGGFRPGDLVIIGARPSVGKSALLLSFVIHAAKTGRRVLLVSMEMTAEQIGERYLARSSGLPLSWFVNDLPLTDKQISLVADGQTDNNPAHVEIYDLPGCTVPEIRHLAQRMKAGGGLDLIAVDYLGLIENTSTKQTRNDEVSEISRALKKLAMSFNVPIIAAHQLNRAGDEAPELKHLRDSGSIEQDANTVILLHRQGDELALRVAKNRQGQTGGVRVRFNGALMKFEEV